MTSFSVAVQSACLAALGALLVYTLGLMRSRRLSAHVTVRWMLVEVAAILAVLLWGRLPFIAYTSSLDDRELLVILAVLFFGLIAFLMLDSLQRISTNTTQIRRLAQEVALLREMVARAGHVAEEVPAAGVARTSEQGGNPPDSSPPRPFTQVLLAVWATACVVFELLRAADLLPDAIARGLTAKYLE